jgi:hypothetical protein
MFAGQRRLDHTFWNLHHSNVQNFIVGRRTRSRVLFLGSWFARFVRSLCRLTPFDGVSVSCFDMFVAIATLPERFATKITWKRFLSRMDELVVLEGVRPVKALAAIITAVPALAAMYQTVLIVHWKE